MMKHPEINPDLNYRIEYRNDTSWSWDWAESYYEAEDKVDYAFEQGHCEYAVIHWMEGHKIRKMEFGWNGVR